MRGSVGRPLPEPLRVKLQRLRRRVRVCSTVSGTTTWLMLVLSAALVGMVADLLWTGPTPVRCAYWGVWLAAALAGLVGLVLRPVLRRHPPEALTASVERTYPHLGERLTSTVELAHMPDVHLVGSAQLIEALARQTAVAADPLNFSRAYPARRAVAGTAGALVLVVALMAGWLSWPKHAALLAERFLKPWANLGRVSRTALDVQPGDRVVARGDDVVVTVTTSGQPVDAATLVWTDSEGREHRTRMICTDAAEAPAQSDTLDVPDQPARARRFALRISQVLDSFAYRVKAGDALSRRYQITAVDRPKVADLAVAVTPPAYTGQPKRVVEHSDGDVEVMQGAQVAMTARLNKPVATATLKLPDGSERPMRLSADRRVARADVPTQRGGTYRLELADEHGLTNRPRPDNELRVLKDQAPVIEMAGPKDARVVPPDQEVPVAARVSDDVQVARTELEVRVDDGPWKKLPADATGLGTAEARVDARLKLEQLDAKPGQIVTLRLAAIDNRPKPGPNVTRSKPQIIKLRTGADSLEKQQAQAQRVQLKRDLAALKEQVRRTRKDTQEAAHAVQHPRRRGRRAPPVSPDPAIARARGKAAVVQDRMRLLAHKLDRRAVVQAMAQPMREMADQDVQRARDLLQDAAQDNGRRARLQRLRRADGELGKVEAQLDRAAKRMEALARLEDAALDLKDLARRQQELAARAEQQAEPTGKPAEQELPRLAKAQQHLADKAQAVLDAVPELKAGALAARFDKAKDLAERAMELSRTQAKLARAEQRLPRELSAKLRRITDAQRRLAQKAVALDRQTRQAAELAGQRGVESEPASEADRALRRGDLGQAEQRQAQAAQALAAGATALRRAVDTPRDTQAEAQQLARRQQQLARKANEAVKRLGRAGRTTTPDAQAARRQALVPLAREQARIARAAQALAEPPTPRSAKQQALARTDQAADDLGAARTDRIGRSQAEAVQALRRLARAIPRTPRDARDRAEQAARRAEDLAHRQRELSQETFRAGRGSRPPDVATRKQRQELERKLTPVAREQKALTADAQRLDAPAGDEHRREALQQMGEAEKALAKSDARRAVAAQARAAKALHRLAGALRPKPEPPPEPSARAEVAALADAQRRLADGLQDAVDRAARDRNAKQAAGQLRRQRQAAAQAQKGLTQRVGQLTVPQSAAKAKAGAVEQAKAAEEAVRDKHPDAAVQRQRDAAEALDRLAQTLPGPDKPELREAAARARAHAAARGLAQKQRELSARLSKKAQTRVPSRPGQKPRAPDVRALASEQAKLAQTLDRVPGRHAPAAKAEARARMQDAQNALRRNDAAGAREHVKKAAEAADALARQLQRQPSRVAPVRVRENHPRQAEGLAREQRRLHGELKALLGPPTPQDAWPQRLAAAQAELAKGVRNLQDEVAKGRGKRSSEHQHAHAARQNAQQAADESAAGRLGQAAEAGKKASHALDRVGEGLHRAKRQGGARAEQTGRLADRAELLARDQRNLAQAMRDQAAVADKKPPELGQEQAALRARTETLGREVQRLAETPERVPRAVQVETQAAARAAGRQAPANMKHAEAALRRRDRAQARGQQQRASEDLREAARHLSRMAQQLAAERAELLDGVIPPERKTQTAAEAVVQMREAARELRGAKPALVPMRTAATKLDQAAREILAARQAGLTLDPKDRGRRGDPPLDTRRLASRLQKYAGRVWGELPGQLKTEILQGLNGEYSDDYARLIKLYFKEIARQAGLDTPTPRQN